MGLRRHYHIYPLYIFYEDVKIYHQFTKNMVVRQENEFNTA